MSEPVNREDADDRRGVDGGDDTAESDEMELVGESPLLLLLLLPLLLMLSVELDQLIALLVRT